MNNADVQRPDCVRELADHLIDAWRSGKPLRAATAVRLAPADEAGAYAVQRMVGESLGWFPTGRPRAWKVGAPTRDAAPTAAPIPDEFLLAAPAHLAPGRLHTLIGIEVELAVRFERRVASGASRAEIARAIGETTATIEIFDVRAQRWAVLPPLFLLADQQMHGRLIVGTGAATAWSDAFAECALHVEVNGQEQARGHGARHPLGDPLHLLPWLAIHAATYADGLRAGDLVTTGTWTGLYEAKPGDHVRAAFAGIGEASVQLRAGPDSEQPLPSSGPPQRAPAP